MIGELVLFEVGKDDGCKGGEKRGAFVYGAVVDRVPYLVQLAGFRLSRHIWAYCLGTSLKDSGAIEVLVVFYGVAVLDDAFSPTKRRRSAKVLLDMSQVPDMYDVLIRCQRVWMYLDAHGA